MSEYPVRIRHQLAPDVVHRQRCNNSSGQRKGDATLGVGVAAVPRPACRTTRSAVRNRVRDYLGPCALVRPRSSQDGVGARLDGWIPRTPSRGFATGVAELGSRGGTSGAYIVDVVGHPYLATLMPLWLTMPSYTSPTPVVLALLTHGGSELVPSGSSRTDQTEREFRNLNGAGADPIE
ncbi:hypothetical protein B296_00052274 [Ensete ventricosum]|uniref:Uncharacterized protein n=1 Tax=Ensete ventricosum TaxID=4639 RepID=A0A426XK02_ENSVE|nr:hypothetical protein B296_00052274 [Ensete ventricosum]